MTYFNKTTHFSIYNLIPRDKLLAVLFILLSTLLFSLSNNVVANSKDNNTVPPSPSGSRIAIANRGADTVSLIDVINETELHIELEADSEPMYAQNPFYSNEIWIGDRANNRVIVYDALRFRKLADIPAGNGVFHMWNHGGLGQMWVVNDIDKTMTVISLETKTVLATIPIPADLISDFKPHDITVTATGAIVSLIGPEANPNSWLIEYSGSTFVEVNRLSVPGDPHLLYWGFENSQLYVASQKGNKVLRINPSTLSITGELTIAGAHGIWANEQEDHLYVSNVTSTTGVQALYTIDIDSFSIVPGSPVNTVLPHPHNVMSSIDDSKLFITHSNAGSESVSVYDITPSGIPINGRAVETGAIPFGIMLIRDPLCKTKKQKK